MLDDPNKRYYEREGVAEVYAENTSLFEAEQAVIASLRQELEGKPILDVGVGAGRTTPYLMAISKDYIGIDYSDKMIRLCGERMPDARLMLCDARDMSAFRDGQFAAAFYCYNGIDEVPPEDRALILQEVYRVLKPGGVFLFSSHNLDWEAVPFDPLSRFSGYAVVMEQDGLTGITLPTYYISKEAQVAQLLDAGFSQVRAVDSQGSLVEGQKSVTDPWLYYVARKV